MNWGDRKPPTLTWSVMFLYTVKRVLYKAYPTRIVNRQIGMNLKLRTEQEHLLFFK